MRNMKKCKCAAFDADAMSCVESYLLQWLRKTDIRLPLIYCESYIEPERAYIEAEKGFAYFTGFPRLQDTLKEAGILRGEVYCGRSIKKGLTLEQTEPCFFDGEKLRPWRDDHFIRLTRRTQQRLYYINCYPPSAGYIPSQEQRRLLSGKRINYRIRSVDCAGLMLKSVRQLERMSAYSPEEIRIKEPGRLRDTLLVLRVSRSRIEAWLRLLQDMGIVRSAAPAEQCARERALLNDMLLLCERSRLRGADESAALAERFEELKQVEYAMAQLLKDFYKGMPTVTGQGQK